MVRKITITVDSSTHEQLKRIQAALTLAIDEHMSFNEIIKEGLARIEEVYSLKPYLVSTAKRDDNLA